MAEERNVGLARAPESPTDDETTKAELQRRMEEARESITQTVTEIKDTVASQYQHVRETISDTLDWREQYRRHPAALSAGALGVGFVLGYSVGGALAGDRERSYDYDEEEDEGRASISPATRSYAAQPITGGAYGSSTYARETTSAGYQPSAGAEAGASQPSARYSAPAAGLTSESSYGGGYAAAAEVPKGPSLLSRFKETKAYDRLQEELSTIGERFVEELSTTARNVVVPALLSKLKDMIGIDLSMQQEVAHRSKLEKQTSHERAQAETAGGQQAGGSSASAATSPGQNRGLGAS